ncbi:monovalent cation/H(+) antiporter subunit G [Bacillus massiliglaciei]|uniref:monovalent cation/H(+) antiporter subunit G n=1 Tax=Bacillus massiliglaciei TaxID=1816693 RepID=UPI000DA6394E|nr:monovalent cation/H(+) antiporter subunit G [Bacillus massiliglaciei]
MNETFKIVSMILILLGTFLILVATFGILRLPDVYTRNHAASKSTTLGIMFILLGTFLYFYYEHGHFNSRVLLAVFFILLTSPVAGHLLSRSAYYSGVKMWDRSVEDDLSKEKEEKD